MENNYKILFILALLSFFSNSLISQQWVAVYNGPSGSIDSVRNIVVDNSGNIYVTGSSTSSNVLDYTTLKYNSGGVLLWESRYDFSAHNIDDAQWITIDNSGNAYVTGYSRSGTTSGTTDFATIKYNADGVMQWSARYNGPAGSADFAVKVAVDISGNVYVTGWSSANGTIIDYATIKYNPSGIQQWAARYNGPGNSLDAPSALAVDNSGNVYVTGWSRSTAISGSEDYLTIKYNSNGAEQWVVRHNGPGNWTDAAASLALDNSGNVFVTGHCYSTEALSDYCTIKYNSAGIQQWTATYNNNAFNGTDLAKMVIVDNSGNVYVTGASGTEYPFGYPNYVTVKYNSSGVQQWVMAYNGTGNGPDEPSSIALDIYGNICVTGKITMPGFFYDFATVKYNPNGTQLSALIFNGASNMQDGATWVTTDNSGNMYVAGNSMYYNNYSSDFVLIKYSSNPTGIKQISPEIPVSFILEQNYPNPFNNETKIRFHLPKQNNVDLRIYNAMGKEVEIILRENLGEGIYELKYDASKLSSGIYFYRMITDNFNETKKMILTK
ncbi:MAG: T9SS C-terminal target domain-containing protein [Ignavibacteriae bacterium]|nr:MAG: T9SS C-terminal target domain-containing protein [Ignavibacteriota bacterium]